MRGPPTPVSSLCNYLLCLQSWGGRILGVSTFPDTRFVYLWSLRSHPSPTSWREGFSVKEDALGMGVGTQVRLFPRRGPLINRAACGWNGSAGCTGADLGLMGSLVASHLSACMHACIRVGEGKRGEWGERRESVCVNEGAGSLELHQHFVTILCRLALR